MSPRLLVLDAHLKDLGPETVQEVTVPDSAASWPPGRTCPGSAARRGQDEHHRYRPHGWPGSIVEFLDLIGLLTAPADPADAAFHLVIPSRPGFGLSGPVPDAGWDSYRIAGALAQLMDRLGYDRCFARVLPARRG
jgi:pimeloyl-ACP methyl ester carboxylesterase